MTHPLAEIMELWAPGDDEDSEPRMCEHAVDGERVCAREPFLGKRYCWRHELIECDRCGIKIKRGRRFCAPCEDDHRRETQAAVRESNRGRIGI